MSDPLIDALLNKQSGQQGQQVQVDPIHDPINALLSKQSNSNPSQPGQQSNNTPPGPIQGAPNGLPGDNPAPLSNLEQYQMLQESLKPKTIWGKINSWADEENAKFDAHPFQYGLSKAGNMPLDLGAVGTSLLSKIPGVGQYIPNATNAGFVHGIANLGLGAAQSLSHLSGIGQNATDSAVNNTENYFNNNYDQSKMGEFIGSSAPFAAVSALEAPSLIAKAPSTLGRIGAVLKPAVIGSTLAPLFSPEAGLNTNNPDDYANRKTNEALVGGGLGLIAGAAPELVRGANGIIRKQTAGNIKLPPEILTGESSGDVLQDANTQFPNTDIDKIQQISQGNPDDPNTQNAKAIISRLIVAGANENGDIPLSLHDVSGDLEGRKIEQELEGKRGSIANDQRIAQGQKEVQAISNLQDKQANIVKEGNNTNNTPNLTNEQTIQQSLNNTYDILKQKEESLYNIRDTEIRTQAPQSPAPGSQVDVQPVVSKIDALIQQNLNSPARDDQVDALLQRFKRNLTNPSGDNSYINVKNSVTQMEAEIENLKSGFSPNRKGASVLNEVSNLLDTQADNWAEPYLSKDPVSGKTSAEIASDFHKDSIVPFQDSDTGLPQILNGQYADKSVKPFFSTASPEQFKNLFNNLDEHGQNAVLSGIIDNAVDFATDNGRVNPQKFAKYMSDRSEHISGMFNDLTSDVANSPSLSPADKAARLKNIRDGLGSIQGLTTTIQNTPRAVSSGLPTTKAGIISTHQGTKLLSGALGYGVGGPLGSLGGLALETGAEMGANNIKSNILFKPDFSSYVSGEIAPKIPPSAPPPETGSLTQPPGQGGGSGPFTPISDNLDVAKKAQTDYFLQRRQNYQDTVGAAETALNKQRALTLQNAATPANFRELELGYNARDASGQEFTDREPTLAELTQLGDRIEGKIQDQSALKSVPINQRPSSLSDDYIDSENKADKIALAKLDAHIENVKNGTLPTFESRLEDIQNAYDAQRDVEIAKSKFVQQDQTAQADLYNKLKEARQPNIQANKTKNWQNSQSQPSTDNLASSLPPNTASGSSASGSPAYGTPQTGITNLGRMGGPDEFPEGPGSWKQQQDKLQQLLSSGKTATNKPGPGMPEPNLSEQTLANQAISEYLAANPKANPTAASKTPTPAEVPPVAWTPEKEAPQTLDEADKQLSGLQSNLQDRIQQTMDAFKGGDKNAALELVHLRSIQQNIDRIKALGGNPLLGASNELDAAQQQFNQLRNTPKTTKPLSTAEAQAQAEKWAAEQSIKNSLAQKPSSIVSDHENYMTHRGGLYTTPNGETGIVPADEVEAIWSSPYLSEKEKISGTSRPSGMSLSQWISELISRGKIGNQK